MSFIRKFKKGDKVYLAEVENQRIGGKVVQRFIRYIGKQADGRTVLSGSLSDVEVQEVKIYGPLLVLRHLAEEIGLPEHLGPCAREILSMVYAHCWNYKSVNHMPKWFARTDLNFLLDLEQVTEERLLQGMDFLEKTDSESLQRAIFQFVKKRYRLRNSGVIYDVTNTYLYGKKCPLGKLGHDKDGIKGRPLIQIGLAVTQDEGIPVFHKTFDGNIADSRTLRDLISTFARFRLPAGTMIYDRGITSARNVAEIKALGWETIAGVPLSQPVKKFWRRWLPQAQRLPFGDRVRLRQTTFYLTARPYRLKPVRGTLYLCFNPRQQVEQRDALREEIVEAQRRLQEGKAIKPALAKYFDARGEVLAQRLRQTEEFDGYSCIFSTRSRAKSELVELYFGNKDLVEKAFRSLKGVIKIRPVRHWLAHRVVAHVFICYLAYLLMALLQFRLRPLGMSAEQALDELHSMYKVYLRDAKRGFRISRLVTLSKKQETILKTIDAALLRAKD